MSVNTYTVEEWQRDAACRDMDTHVFFPEGRGLEAATREAVAVCRDCPVVEECLRYAIDQGLTHGVYGGTTEKERRHYSRLVLTRCTYCDKPFYTQRGAFCSGACRKAQSRKRGRGRYQRRTHTA